MTDSNNTQDLEIIPPQGVSQEEARAFCARHGMQLEAVVDGANSHWACWREPNTLFVDPTVPHRVFFYVSGTDGPAPVWRDPGLTDIYPLFKHVGGCDVAVRARGGEFPPIYFSPAVIYRAKVFNAFGELLADMDPCFPTNKGPIYPGNVVSG